MKWRAHAAVLAICIMGVGCADNDAAEPVKTSSSQPSGTSPTAEPAPSGQSSESGYDSDDVSTDQTQLPTNDPRTIDQGSQFAQQAVKAWAQPNLPHEQWWRQLSGFYTKSGARNAKRIDPANIAASTVTGAPTASGAQSDFLLTVTVPTDVGDHSVLLVRHSHSSPWKVEKITPPEHLG